MNEAPFPNFLPTFKPLFPSLKFAQQVVFGNFSTLTAISLTTELSLFPLEPYTVQLSIMEGKHRSTVLLHAASPREDDNASLPPQLGRDSAPRPQECRLRPAKLLFFVNFPPRYDIVSLFSLSLSISSSLPFFLSFWGIPIGMGGGEVRVVESKLN